MTVPLSIVVFFSITTMPLRIVNPKCRAIGLLHTILVDHLNVAADSQVLVQDRVGNRGPSADPLRPPCMGTHDSTCPADHGSGRGAGKEHRHGHSQSSQSGQPGGF